MSNEELIINQEALRATAKRAMASPEALKAYFVELGLIDEAGQFTEPYRALGAAMRPVGKKTA